MFQTKLVTASIAIAVGLSATASTVTTASAKVRNYICYIDGYRHYCHAHRHVQYLYAPYGAFYNNNYSHNYNHQQLYQRFYTTQPSRVVNIDGHPVRVYYSRH
jgi:hypothetical protein